MITDSQTFKSSYTVTVVTATWNALAFLDRCVQSVDSQRLPEGLSLEHLIIDGVSKDGTLEYLKEWEQRSPNHRFISEPDKGLYDAMNKGAEQAGGDIIVFLNADDKFYDESSVACSILPILEGKGDYSCSTALMVDDQGNTVYEQIPDLSTPYLNHPFNTQTLFLKRADFLALGGHNLSYRVAADTELDYKLIHAGKKAYVVPGLTIVAQDGGFGVSHYYAHERARLLDQYKDEIAKRCSENKRYAYEFFLALIRISKVHPSAADVEKKKRLRAFSCPYIGWEVLIGHFCAAPAAVCVVRWRSSIFLRAAVLKRRVSAISLRLWLCVFACCSP